VPVLDHQVGQLLGVASRELGVSVGRDDQAGAGAGGVAVGEAAQDADADHRRRGRGGALLDRTQRQVGRSFHFRYAGADYRVAYEVDENEQAVIVWYAASRENFYTASIADKIAMEPRQLILPRIWQGLDVFGDDEDE
jgi:hypothetical protein